MPQQPNHRAAPEEGGSPDSESLPAHGRLWANERGQQLVEVATRILGSEGVDGVRIPEVAAAAGVTRPTVYKHFPNRQALLIAILESYGRKLQQRFDSAPIGEEPKLTVALQRVFGAICDSIEDEGEGAWNLLSSSGPDPEVERVSQQVRQQLIQPWLTRVAEVTRASEKEAELICGMVVATTAALLRRWLNEELPRERAIEAAMRATRALIKEFAS